ncbi:hypothetical protein Mpop_3230 [Methylorubrum populi BJ001]|uniref:Uncharacterized protein n=1 Tax=Methylorubrum populi (strain ATCC BAA-705 / NCIMB 13946 / BJ001) TaxID=441620 RepID=B1ZHR3_METPB|nr:hypothetical protein [Methylorubrum populi]ACB81381.1 hypothetical protein Mpop_3230 [Methylorubrum populi BJ001]OAH34610.1 hypothetical protein AX289_02845 [Methylorubrum populi]PZP72386.1 MAG: hypothetical protein DI590_02275 [Methylorubrum populi]
MSAGGKSGPALGAENVEKLRAYLDDLRKRGLPLPSRGGEINLSAIALACGFNRQVFYVNEGARSLLADAAARPAPGGADPDDVEGDEKPVTRSDRRDRRIHQLEQANAALRAENHGLRERLRRLEHVEAVMMTGRRVAP